MILSMPSFPDSGETFLGDKEVILEVLENLLSNALRYAETFVEISVELHREELKLCVMDDGSGFSESGEEGQLKTCRAWAVYQQAVL